MIFRVSPSILSVLAAEWLSGDDVSIGFSCKDKGFLPSHHRLMRGWYKQPPNGSQQLAKILLPHIIA